MSWLAKRELLSQEKGNDDVRTGVTKYAAQFINAISGKTTATEQLLTSVQKEPSADDTETCNSNDTEKVSLNIEPSAPNEPSAVDKLGMAL